MLNSKLTKKFQATIPKEVRKFLKLGIDDYISFEFYNNKIIIRKSSPLDLEYAKSVESTLTEWTTENDEEAYGDL